jgi:hypothetical protein
MINTGELIILKIIKPCNLKQLARKLKPDTYAVSLVVLTL